MVKAGPGKNPKSMQINAARGGTTAFDCPGRAWLDDLPSLRTALSL